MLGVEFAKAVFPRVVGLGVARSPQQQVYLTVASCVVSLCFWKQSVMGSTWVYLLFAVGPPMFVFLEATKREAVPPFWDPHPRERETLLASNGYASRNS